MKSLTKTTLLLIALLTAVLNFACTSNSQDPLAPSGNLQGQSDLTSEVPLDGRQIIGAWHFTADTSTGEVQVTESRELAKRFNVSKMAIKSWLGQYSLDHGDSWEWHFFLTLKNPSQVTGYDVRGIFIPNPFSGDGIINPDDYTNQWNSMSPYWLNGFKAYAKEVDKRAFKGGAEHTEEFVIFINNSQNLCLEWDIVVEASYPVNCDGAYEISNQKVSNSLGYGANSTTISMDVKSHTGNVEYVWVDTTPFNGGLTYLTYQGGTLWSGEIVNSNYAPVGVYRCKITTDSYYYSTPDDPGEQLFDIIDIKVIP